jgi:hypothetical protein
MWGTFGPCRRCITHSSRARVAMFLGLLDAVLVGLVILRAAEEFPSARVAC